LWNDSRNDQDAISDGVLGGLKDDFCLVGWDPQWKWANFGGEFNVTYRENAALWCGCSTLVAE